MMVRFVPENGHCAVDLLDGHYSYHLVREGHERKGDLAIGAIIDRLAESVGAADDEHQVFAGRHLPLQKIRELEGAVFPAMLIKQEHVHSGREETQHLFPFGGLELVLGQRLGIFDIRQHDELERHVVGEPLLIVLDERHDAGVTRLPRDQQGYLHWKKSFRSYLRST